MTKELFLNQILLTKALEEKIYEIVYNTFDIHLFGTFQQF